MPFVTSTAILAILPLLLPLFLCLRLVLLQKDEDNYNNKYTIILAYLVMAVLGWWATSRLVPHIKEYTLRKGIFGKDLGKRGTDRADVPVPEALGIVPGSIFLVCLIFCLVGYASRNDEKEHQSKVLEINSALLSVCFMLFLGFTDDVLDWPWRYKLVLPTVASLPLLCCYNGSTTIVVPVPLRSWLWNSSTDDATWLGHLAGWFITVDSQAQGSLVDLGYIYLIYMGLLAVFCTNAINIFAGINGLEAGQSYIIACAILIHNLIEISAAAGDSEREEHANNHMFSLMTMLSFVGVTLGLLQHNWYPASVFVGDTYCYFAGMTFACVGILGHFSKTLLLFCIPQILNFLWSLPQLFHLVPCPRHRLPHFNPRTGRMEPSTYTTTGSGGDEQRPNRTLICVVLQVCGPMTERDLCLTLLVFQAVCCALGFVCRYTIADLLF